MTDDTIHTCSYSCERPGCIRAQRDYLAARLTAETSNARGEWPARYACNGPEGAFWTDDATLANKLIAAAFDRDEWTVTDTQNPTAAAPPPPSAPEPEVHSYDPTDQRQSVTIRWPGGKCLGYVLDRTRYTDNLPPSAPAGVDFAAVASILRRAMRDGAHYGYRRDFILQQALALEALSQQPAAVDGPDAQAAEIESLRAEVAALQRELGALHMHAKQRDQYAVEKAVQALDWKKRAEQLEEVLRELVDVFSESGMYDEEAFDKASAALGKESGRE